MPQSLVANIRVYTQRVGAQGINVERVLTDTLASCTNNIASYSI